MKAFPEKTNTSIGAYLSNKGFSLKAKLLIVFFIAKIIPLILLTIFAWSQITKLGVVLKDIAVEDSQGSLQHSAIDKIERMTTDTAFKISDFLYQRDNDILYLAQLEPDEASYLRFLNSSKGKIADYGKWQIDDEKNQWVLVDNPNSTSGKLSDKYSSYNKIDDISGDLIYKRSPVNFEYNELPLYDEITFINLAGQEIIKVTAENSSKKHYPLSPERKNISKKENTYIKSEDYFEELKKLGPGEIYVSEVIGAYVGTNYIGVYTPQNLNEAENQYGYKMDYEPENQAYSGNENPVGQQFEGIIRWGTPVYDENNKKIGYVSFALNHDHLLEITNHISPTEDHYVQIPQVSQGNYAFVWDHKCRVISHPKHHAIVGYNPTTVEQQVPWVEDSIYNNWKESGIESWTDFSESIVPFNDQSRDKTLSQELQRAGLVGYDGRFLNNAPQCGKWMDLTEDGSSGVLYIFWDDVYKVTTAAAIPYYTSQYAPCEENNFTQRGFGFVVIGAELDSFLIPADVTAQNLEIATSTSLQDTVFKLLATSIIIILFVSIIAIWLATALTNRIKYLNNGISRFESGERHFRFNATIKDEFGDLANSFDDMANSIVKSVNKPLAIINMSREIIYMNKHGLELCRINDIAEVEGINYSNISIYPYNTKYCPVTALENNTEAEIYYLEKQNMYVKGKADYFLDKNGTHIGYIIETNDVTTMVLEQMEIERQNTLLDQIFSVSPDLIWLMDKSGKYITVNPRFAEIAGKDPIDFSNKTAHDMLPKNIADLLTDNDRKAMDGCKYIYSEEQIKFANGHEETLDCVRTPVLDANGKQTGILGFARDVTTRVKIESELRKTQIELEKTALEANAANEHKGEFLARMSHEIRTPMNAIIGLTDITLKKVGNTSTKEELTQLVKDNMGRIGTSSTHLLGLINDILDISKIEAGKIELIDEIVDLPKLIETVADIIRPRCEEKDIVFKTNFSNFNSPSFITDSLRLRQVLINLLGNAVKFTPINGTVEFNVNANAEEKGDMLVSFSVKDTGIGIHKEAHNSIFQSFEQGNGKISKQYGGTGLGLAISNRIVNMLGGEIKLESEPGKGSVFSFEIWLPKSEDFLADIEETDDITGKLAGKKALVVDDVDINRMIVSSMLEDTGIEIDEASDGTIALEMFENSPENTYDIIFMDIQMPMMNGYEASRAIRSLGRNDSKSVYIIALTANAFKDDIDKAISNGMNSHIAKPIDTDMLNKALFKYLHSFG